MFFDIDDLAGQGFLEVVPQESGSSGDHDSDEDVLDVGDDGDDEKDLDYVDDDEDNADDNIEHPNLHHGRIRHAIDPEPRPRRRFTVRPCGIGLQPLQASLQSASLDENDRMKKQNPVRSGMRARAANEHDDEDVEMCDDTGSDGEDPCNSEEHGTGKAYHPVKGFVEITGEADKINVTLYLMSPGYKFRCEYPPDEQDHIALVRTREDLSDDGIMGEYPTQTLWDKFSSHFFSNASVASGPRFFK